MDCRWIIVALKAVILVVVLHGPSAAEPLPSEATLPGKAAKPRALPGEDTLPGRVIEPRPLPSEATLPGHPRPIAQRADLPSEAALPLLVQQRIQRQEQEDEEQGDEEQAELPAIEARPEDQPWLQLNMRGHTGTVRALAFTAGGRRLGSAGEDKAVEVWGRPELEGLGQRGWMHERTIRWQIQRGPRGRIYSLAAGTQWLALAGHGAMGGLGEILLVDPATGQFNRALVDEKVGHRQVITALSFSPDEQAPVLASMDIQGQANVWRQDADTGLWSTQQLIAPDKTTYGEQTAAFLQLRRRFALLTMAGPQHVIVPVFTDRQVTQQRPDGIALWHLERINIDTGARQRLTSERPHYDLVTALAASADGRRLVSADAFGNLFFWDLQQGGPPQRLAQPAAVISISLARDGQTLLVGTARSPRLQNQAALQLWDLRNVQTPQKTFEQRVTRHVYACTLDADSQQFAYSQDNAVVLHPLATPGEQGQTLRAPVRLASRVAFAKEQPYYRIAFGTAIATPPEKVPLEEMFDPGALQLGREPEIDQQAWIPHDWWQGDWSLRTHREQDGETYWLYRGEQRRARLPLVAELDGAPTAICWIPDRKGRPHAVAVGTAGQNNIYVFRLADSGLAPLLRQFRGHAARVTSLGISRDRRYLVSASTDATIRIWKLQDFDRDDLLLNRWGAGLEIQDGQLVVASIREDGPLFFRGMRQHDVLQQVQWHDGQQVQTAEQPQQILDALRDVSRNTIVVFQYIRGRVEQPGFQMYPAWQQVVSLFVAENREWAYWTPAGYYDASFDGHKLFGWQINRGLDRLPEFFMAAQLRKSLERPGVMEKLLPAGSLEGAFRMARREPPANPHLAIEEQYRLKPQIAILTPDSGGRTSQSVLPVRAAITIRRGQQLVPPKAFANGVVAGDPRLVSEQDVPGGIELVYQWDAPLPSEPRILVQVIAATEAQVAEYQSVIVHRDELPPRQPGRLFLFAAGINQYRDAQIQRLEFAVDNARKVIDTFQQRAGSLYHPDPIALLGDHATRSLWTITTQEYLYALKDQVTADDLVVVFLSGHGVRDEETEKYYYVTADARFADIRSQRYADCISFEDFAVFAELPCRKLVILDTCHSGAVQQPLRQQDLKAALRALQEDVIFTMTASEGHEEAVEERERRLGRFTFRLLEALQGAADQPQHGGNGDGIVTLHEAIGYVQRMVAEDSARDEFQQHPTAGPLELLEFVALPLTQTAGPLQGHPRLSGRRAEQPVDKDPQLAVELPVAASHHRRDKGGGQ